MPRIKQTRRQRVREWLRFILLAPIWLISILLVFLARDEDDEDAEIGEYLDADD